MFTGIVEEVGKVVSYDGRALVVQAHKVLGDLKVSESICVAGACLTVISRDSSTFTVETVPETVERTSFRLLKPGSGVNLERALAAGGRMGGHIVQGHVDGTAELSWSEPDGNSLRILFMAPPNIMRYVVEKGFITVDGVSLTVTGRTQESFSVAIIPYTLAHTTIGERRPGDPVNIETDVVAKYVETLVSPHIPPQAG